MKVLFAGGHSYYPEFSGGVQSSTHHLIGQLRKLGHDAAVLTALFGDGYFGFKARAKLKLLRQPAVVDKFTGYPVIRAWFPWHAATFAANRIKTQHHIVPAHAYLERTYWALFIGGMTTMVFTTLGWASSHWRPGAPRWVGGTGGMIRFEAGITGFSFANYSARNLDQILIGRRWGNQEVGFYDRAKTGCCCSRCIKSPTLLPRLWFRPWRMSSEPERYRRAYLRVASLLLLIALPGVAVAIAAADLLIPLALGQQWHQSATIFQALGFAGLLQPLNNPAGWLFVSQGRSWTSCAGASLGL